MVIGRDEPAGSGRSQGRPRDGHHTGDQIGEGQQQAGRWQRQAAAAAGCHGAPQQVPGHTDNPDAHGELADDGCVSGRTEDDGDV